MTTAHLTPTELDALLEVAKWNNKLPAVDGYYWWRADENDTPDPCLLRNGLVYDIGEREPQDLRMLGGQWMGPSKPATVTRLVLMVRELQQEHDRFSDLADKRHDELSEARRQRDSMAANLDKYSRDVVEHFRARAVRAIESKYGLMNHDYFAELIKSLPLVETEDDNAV